ncbi:MAG: HNH endonuclease [Alphaproteobacteria bacterium]|nr:HNH endonuclease [Alphaproteobacteria bacterium]
MPTDAQLLSVIADALRNLREPKKIRVIKSNRGNSISGIPQVAISKEAAAILKKSENYATRCKALAKQFGCTFAEQINGEFSFAKLGDLLKSGKARRKKRPKKVAVDAAPSPKVLDPVGLKPAPGRMQSKPHVELRPTVTNRALWWPNRPPKAEWDKIRKIVLERDNYICQFCGHRATKWMNIHHAGNSSNNDPGNLITSCVACHAVLHIGHNLALGVIEIWKSELSQMEIVQRTRNEIKNGKSLCEIKSYLSLKPTKLLPSSEEHANNLLRKIGDREAISLPKPLCAVFVNFKRWQIE